MDGRSVVRNCGNLLVGNLGNAHCWIGLFFVNTGWVWCRKKLKSFANFPCYFRTGWNELAELMKWLHLSSSLLDEVVPTSLFETGRVLIFPTYRVGAYRGWAVNRVNTVTFEDMILALVGQFKQLSHEPEKFRWLNGIRTHDLCDAGAVL